IEVITKDGEKIYYQLENIQTNDNQTTSGVIDAFIKSIQLDEDPLVTGEDAISSLKVILGIIEAAESNNVVTI
ncbi:dehydrogenase, partial [Pseudomonas sp. FW305-BF6]|uniref:hypothetical protein n=1 Tax=Pseudomonas sp. FW305-BF6 TaxID=2070673 RepID=UPI000CBC1C83